jgi:hypothetical protein
MWKVDTRPTSASDFIFLVFKNLFEVVEMATDRKVKSTKKFTKPSKSPVLFFKRKAHYILLFQNRILSMYVCKATVQDYEKNHFKNPELFPDFWGKKSKKRHGFYSKTSTFRCSNKI